MANRLTLLLVTQAQLARIDVVGGASPRVKGVWTLDRIPGESLATLADGLLRAGPKKLGDVWLFSHEFWTGVVHLASDIAGVLEGDELDQAIALEAETYSGISAFESRLGVKALPRDGSGEARWWVTQIAQRDWRDVDQVVKQRGGTLSGMGHPSLAAFPSGFAKNSGDFERQPWRLNQAFGESTISLNGVGGEIQDVITLGDLKTQRTRSQLFEWCEQTEGTGQLAAWVTDQPLPELFNDTVCSALCLTDGRFEQSAEDEHAASRIEGEAAARVWAETIATAMEKDRHGATRMPVAIARKPPMSSNTALLVACALGVIVALGCFGLHQVTLRKLADLDGQIEKFNKAKKTLNLDKSAVQSLEKQVAQKQEALQDLLKTNRRLSNDLSEAARVRQFQQTRWLELISALARANEGGCWIRGLETRNEVVTIQGLAASNQEISIFATNLERYASPHGWRVHPAQTERNELALIDFEVSLDVSDASPLSHDGVLQGAATALAGTNTGSLEQ